MAKRSSKGSAGDAPSVSIETLPSPEQIPELVANAYLQFKSNKEGENSQVYAALVAGSLRKRN